MTNVSQRIRMYLQTRQAITINSLTVHVLVTGKS